MFSEEATNDSFVLDLSPRGHTYAVASRIIVVSDQPSLRA